MESQTQNNIRPRTKKTRFWVDNEILEIFGQTLKPHGISVYAALARHANSKTQICFPSYERIMQISGIGKRNTITKYINIIEKIGLIKVVRNNKRKVNVYLLLDPRNIKLDRSQMDTVRVLDVSIQKGVVQYLNGTDAIPQIDTLNKISNSNKEVSLGMEKIIGKMNQLGLRNGRDN